MNMSLLKKYLGSGDDSPEEYPQAEFENQEETEQQAEHVIQTVEVSGSKDILTVKDNLHEGNIVFMELSSRAQLSDEHIVEDVKQTVEQLGGDIVHRAEDEVIVAPSGFYISRDRQ